MFLPGTNKVPIHRHNAALKILFFELLREHGLIEEVPPWYSPVMPKPAYQTATSEAFWDIFIYAERNEVRANRIDARVVSHERKEVCTIEMSCPWIESRAKKDEEKTLKYGPMMRVEQYNEIIDVLGGYSKHLEKSVRKLLGARVRSVLERMQKSVISNTLNIARTFKIVHQDKYLVRELRTPVFRFFSLEIQKHKFADVFT